MISYPWDSLVTGLGENGYPIYDRQYDASNVREVNKAFFSSGVFLNDPNALQVSAGDGMHVIVAAGKCLIEGTIGYESAPRELAIQAAGTLDRIDTVVVRWNANVEMRNMDLYVKTGTQSEAPVAPTLTRSESVWEIGLCNLFITRNSGAISAARITDTRMMTERCGAVTPLIEIDMTSFYEMMNAKLAELEATLEEQTQRAVDLAQSAIDGTTAGNLQNQIDANKATDDERYAEFKEFRDDQSKELTKTITYSQRISVPANGAVTIDKTLDVPDGYRLLSAVGARTFNTYVVVSDAYAVGRDRIIAHYQSVSNAGTLTGDVIITADAIRV